MSTPSPNPAQLLQDLDWIQGLALSLASDSATADDLAQETLARALKKAPEKAPRPWLATVMRNLAREGRRKLARRKRREQAAARPEILPSTVALAEQLELQRLVAKEVLALEEPTRSTLLLRYVNGLTPTEIAQQQSISPATVRSRLKRGLHELRSKLDHACDGERQTWMSLLLLPVHSSRSVSGGIALLSAKVVIAATAATAIGLVWNANYGANPQSQSYVSESAATDHNESRLAPPTLRAERSALESKPLDSPLSKPVGEVLLTGHIIDSRGRPIAGAELFVGAEEDPFPNEGDSGEFCYDSWVGRVLTTDSQGLFRAKLTRPGPIEIRALLAARYRGSSENADAVLALSVQAPAKNLELVLARNEIATLAVRAFNVRSNQSLESFRVSFESESLGYAIASAQDGCLALTVPLLTGKPESVVITLAVPSSDPPLQRTVLLAPGEERELTLVLQPESLVHGQVTDEKGQPVSGATAFFGNRQTALGDEPFEFFSPHRIPGATTDENGRFELAGTGSHVSVFHPAHALTTVEMEDAFSIIVEPRGRILGQGASNGALTLDERPVAPVAESRFELTALEPGAHRLDFSDGSSACVRVRAGETTELNLAERFDSVQLKTHSFGQPDSRSLEGYLIGLDSVSTIHPLKIRQGQVTLKRVLPGRYQAFLEGGLRGEVQIANASAVLNLGVAELHIRAEPDARILLIPSRADELIHTLSERMPAKCDGEGLLVLSPFPACQWALEVLETGVEQTVTLEAGAASVDLRKPR